MILHVERQESRADLTLRWRGGMITKLDVPLKRFQAHGPTTDEDTLSLLRRLAAHYPDEVIAGILNRQGRKTADGGVALILDIDLKLREQPSVAGGVLIL